MKWNNKAMDDLSKSPGIVAVLTETAERVQADMVAAAPAKSNKYRDSFQNRIKYQRRAVAIVENTDPKALAVEARTGFMARMLKKARRRG